MVWSRRVRVGLVSAVLVAVVAVDLALVPAAVASPVVEVGGDAGQPLSVMAGRRADPSDLPGVSSERRAADLTEPVALDGPVPGSRQPDGWVAPGVRGFVEGESVEDVSLTSETRRVWRNRDGSTTEELASHPVRYRDDAGVWREFDTSLVKVPGGGFEPVAGQEGAAVASSADGEAVVSSPTVAGVVSLAQPDAAAVRAVPGDDDSSVRFPGAVGDGADLVVKLLPEGFETSVVVAHGDQSSFEQVLSVPVGVVARAGGPGVELVDESGKVIASYGSGVAVDAASRPDEAPVSTALVGQSGGEVTVRVSVDQRWLRAPGRVFPVEIDPVFSQNTVATGALDTYVDNGSSTPQSTSTALRIGKYASTGKVRRSLLKFDLSSITGANRAVLSATLGLMNSWSASCTGKAVSVAPLTSGFNASTVWSNQPSGGAAVVSAPFAHGFSSSCGAAIENIDVRSIVQRWVDGSSTNYGFRVFASETDSAEAKDFSSAETIFPPTLSVTYNRPVSVPGVPSAPADGQVLQNESPTLVTTAGTDPDGDALQHWWRVTTAPGGEGQQVAVSGWQAAGDLDWQPPAGVLRDGQTYYWSVATWDGVTGATGFSADRSFTMDLRLGAGVWPTDDLGPVSVNLTNGNLTLDAGSPSMPGVGGVSYSYNSRTASTFGLEGAYYGAINSSTHEPPVGASPLMVRRDLVPSFTWNASPGKPLPNDGFYVTWTGYIRVPTSGGYKLGGPCNSAGTGGVRYSLDGHAMSNWAACSADEATAWSDTVTLAAGDTVPVEAEFYNQSGVAGFNLKVRGPGLPYGTGIDAPADWLVTEAASALPNGWEPSADLAGAATYQRVTVEANTATITDVSGAAHRYTRASGSQPWVPPTGESGTLTVNADGSVTLLDGDGTTYLFAAGGSLTETRSALDVDNPSMPIQTYTGTPLRLSKITDPTTATTADPLTGKSLRLYYAGDANCPASPPAGLAAPASGSRFLCRVDYSDFGAGVTDLWYTTGTRPWNQQLARIVNPGDTGPGSTAPPEVTDFAYGTNGLLAKVRDPFAASVVAAGLRSNDDSTMTLVSYDSAGRVAGVKSPEPDAGEARIEHTYDYTSSTSTHVNAAGLTSTTGHLRTVTFDDEGRTTVETDQAGRSTSNVWDADGQLASVRDATGLKTTTEFDETGNPVTEWGPAPSSWWSSPDATGAPVSAKQSITPVKRTRYDEGINTLAATWWNNPDFAGTPAGYSTGINPSDDRLYMSWGTGGPAELGGGTQNFSGRITGYIKFDNTSPWGFQVSNLNGSYTLAIGDQTVIDASSTTSQTFTGTYTPTATGWAPISVDYSDQSSTDAKFGMWWRQGTGAFVRIPTDHTKPGYGNATSTTDPVGVVSTISYTDPTAGLGPEEGLPVSVVSDAGAGKLNLTATTTYEPGTGYRREIAATLPLGAASSTTKTYYGDTEMVDDPCTPAVDPAPQGGGLKTTRAADPAGSGGAGGLVTTMVYDAEGRTVATKVGSDDWTCNSYDATGRLTQISAPAVGSSPGRVTTFNWAVSANPLATSQSDTVGTGPTRTVTTVVDLLGRTRQYQDAWGNTTTTSYDQVGRPTQQVSPVGTQTIGYDANGDPGATVLDAVTLATPHYDTAGRLSWVQYANGVRSDSTVFDDYGRPQGLTLRRISDNTVLSTETATYDLAGRVTDLVTDGNTPNPSGPDYTYDGAGRLVDAYTTARNAGGTVSTLHTSYDFGTATGCGSGAQTNAGRNTNRTSQTIGSTTTTYCYDAADRLLSTNEPGVGTITYDGHGNTTGIWSETRGYDSTNRHLTTTKPDGTSVTYQRDATDRIIARTSTTTGGTPDQAQRYGFIDDTDTPSFTTNTAGTIIETTLTLPGGAIRTHQAGGDTWSIPNLHGDIVATLDNSGTQTGTTTYAPYGETNTTLDNNNGNLDYGWLGQHKRPTEHQTGLAATIEMGARQYDPTLGRFLETDPIEKGSANPYEYALGEPVSNADLDGTSVWFGPNQFGCYDRPVGGSMVHQRTSMGRAKVGIKWEVKCPKNIRVFVAISYQYETSRRIVFIVKHTWHTYGTMERYGGYGHLKIMGSGQPCHGNHKYRAVLSIYTYGSGGRFSAIFRNTKASTPIC